jgi:Peptidase family M28
MQRRRVLALLLLAHGLAGCAREPAPFSDQNASALVRILAGAIGSRPIGTPANARARAYIIDQLRIFGFEVRVQEADARAGSAGLTARVSNIIAVRAGRRPEAIGLLAHYDSVSDSPGAADDALGVAISLEAARVLAARTDRNWSLMVLLTDGEEAGLMGARALMTDREVTSRLQTYINIEAIGSAGQGVLFETGPGNGWLLRPWARQAPHPRGASFGIEVYRRLPNDTDFSILKRHEIPGLNLAAIEDSYAYHTARDTPDRLSPAVVRRTGEQVVGLVSALDKMDITARSNTDVTYFDIGGTAGVTYGPVVFWVVAVGALLLGVLAWVKVTAAAIRRAGVLRWLLTCFWTLIGAALVVASMIGATWALRAAREVNHPWYARPDRLFVLMFIVGLAVSWSVARLGRWLPERARGLRHPLVVWSVMLPVWIVLASASVWLAPGAAFLWVLPLLVAGLLLSILPLGSETWVRVASVVVLAVVGTLWLRDTVVLLRFVVAIFGRLPMVTPVFVYAAVMTVSTLMVAPPFVAAMVTLRPLLRPALVTSLLLVAVAVSAGAAYVAPAYTYEQPLRRHVRALQEHGEGQAIWEVASVEPGLDLGSGAPTDWRPVSTAAPATIPWSRRRWPFVFRTTGPTLGAPPLGVAGFTIQPVAAGTELALTVLPREPGLAISFVLASGIAPARSTLPGVFRHGHWTATYLAPPPEGITFRASFGAVDAARLADTRILVTADGFPNGEGWQRLPGWLPQERAVWTAEATWVVVPSPVPLASTPPLR